MTNVKSMKMLKSGVLKTIRTYNRKASVCGFDIDFGLNMSRFIQQFCPKKRKHSNNHLNNHYQCRLCWLYTTALTSMRGRTYTPSSIGKHFRDNHSSTPRDLTTNFTILKKCNSKFDCLIYEMFFINELRPSLNVLCDSI